jgi:hypothetical protein
MTGLVIKLPVKVLVFIVLISFLLFFKGSLEAKVKIISISNPVYIGIVKENITLKQACNNWMIDSDDVVSIFNLSIKYNDEGGIRREFYWLPCEIRGKLESNGTEWTFVINAASTSIWKNNEEEIYWGCKKIGCNEFFLLPFDGLK